MARMMAEAEAANGPRSLVLCADDYGMNGGISEAILALAETGRLSATSCMTTAPGWATSALGLRPLGGRIGIGLHLSLTWGRPLGPMPLFAASGAMPPLGVVVRQALLRRLPEREIAEEIGRQLDAFVEAMGHAPDFVDGHQHVHVLPGIRRALLDVLTQRGLAGRVWLRDSGDRIPSIMARRLAGPKALLVHGLAEGFRAAAAEAGFATNEGFSGFSHFDPARPVGPDMARYLTALGPRPLVMCHPGQTGPGDAEDEIAAARHRELAYLASAAFGDLLAARGLVLAASPARGSATL